MTKINQVIVSEPPKESHLYFEKGMRLPVALWYLFRMRYLGMYGSKYPDAVIAKGYYSWQKYCEHNFNANMAKVSNRRYTIVTKSELKIGEDKMLFPVSFHKLDCRNVSNWVEYLAALYLKHHVCEFRIHITHKDIKGRAG